VGSRPREGDESEIRRKFARGRRPWGASRGEATPLPALDLPAAVGAAVAGSEETTAGGESGPASVALASDPVPPSDGAPAV